MFENMVLFWFLAGLVLIIAEFAVPGIVLIFFGVGAWVASLTTWIGLTDSMTSQIIVFIIASVVLLISLRRFVKNAFVGRVNADGLNPDDLGEFVGRQVTVLETVNPGTGRGKVDFKGAQWSAASDQVIEAGKLAEIIRVDGLTLVVGPADRKES